MGSRVLLGSPFVVPHCELVSENESMSERRTVWLDGAYGQARGVLFGRFRLFLH